MPEIARLTDVDPRLAWKHEAHDFTPWLAEHLDQLGDVVGIPLELRGQEVAVESFSADILARNLADDSLVLIENQIGTTDHGHLGQIMTYLAGLEAKTVVWIATDFREPHVSALKWLNDHTPEGYNFFAIRLRVVRIAESPFAPVFEVVARPNAWERQLQAEARADNSGGEVAMFRLEFWKAYLARHPEDAALGIAPASTSSVWANVDPAGNVILSLWVGRTKLGIFVRGQRGTDGALVAKILEPKRDALEASLGAKWGRTTGSAFYDRHMRVDMTDRANWPAAIDWLHETTHRYLAALRAALSDSAP